MLQQKVGPVLFVGICCPRVYHYHIDNDELWEIDDDEEDKEEEEQGDVNRIMIMTQVLNVVTIAAMLLCYIAVIRRVKKSREAIKQHMTTNQARHVKRTGVCFIKFRTQISDSDLEQQTTKMPRADW